MERAFKVYDELRRPRTQKAAKLSRQFRRMYAFTEEGIGDDLNKMRAILGARAKLTSDDLEAMNQEAVRKFLERVE